MPGPTILSQDLVVDTDLSPQQLTHLAVDLRKAVKECKDRGLLTAAKWANELLVSIPSGQRKPPLPEFYPRYSLNSEADFGNDSMSERSRRDTTGVGGSGMATPSKEQNTSAPSNTSTPMSLRRVIVNRNQRLNGTAPAPERQSTASSISMSIDSGTSADNSGIQSTNNNKNSNAPSPSAKSSVSTRSFGQRRKSRFSLGEVFSVRPSRRREPLDLGLGDEAEDDDMGDDSGMLPMDEETEDATDIREEDGQKPSGAISPPGEDEFDMLLSGGTPAYDKPRPGPATDMPAQSSTDDATRHERFVTEWEIEKSELDLFEMGKSYYDTKELERCYEVLGRCKSKKAKFLRLYAKYLSADRRAQEMMPHFMDTKTETEAIAPYVYPILDLLGEEEDSYLIYL
ncbi:hypothetical protein QFC22_000118 [Naganishia vaughanmartiniae]|uniref:Uncharacterized protein n=1 Tax=Naganishia vaughanmartiniae TaxID=1424756 RepID=A0ACC2XNZ5_9TREE|nr:hypothetical protein QFC22_000118 [Naganishia vaughanmartiniae]